MKKRSLLLLLSLTALLALGGCGKDENEPPLKPSDIAETIETPATDAEPSATDTTDVPQETDSEEPPAEGMVRSDVTNEWEDEEIAASRPIAVMFPTDRNSQPQYGIGSVEECREICQAKGFDPYTITKNIQPICFEDAAWAYTVGAAIALKKGVKNAAEAAEAIGIGLQAFCIPGSVAEDRKVGIGHGNLGAMLLRNETKCFAFLAGHESFAAAEGAIGIARSANKARTEPLRVILNGLGKDAAQIISRINGFTYVQTQFDYYTGELKIVKEYKYSEGERAAVRCYGADDVREGVAIMRFEGVDVSITGNSTNPTRFQHPVAGTYKKECIEQGRKYFSVASGGGTGRTLHPDNMAAGPASYGLTDTMGRMHGDAQFAGSSSVPAHVEMMGFLGMGNNPMVGATVSVAVAVEESLK